jgi:glycogen(starch) synthase
MGKQLMEMALKGQMVDSLKFSKEDEVLLKRRIQAVKRRESLPPIVTHNMVSDQDEILQHLRRIQMFNRPEDRVKVRQSP